MPILEYSILIEIRNELQKSIRLNRDYKYMMANNDEKDKNKLKINGKLAKEINEINNEYRQLYAFWG